MEHGSETTRVVSKEACFDWPRGQCRWGSNCLREHHANLDPALFEQREHQNYVVPNEAGTLCANCASAFRQCDKSGRGGADDPCSECRWFSGANGTCMLAPDTSYNDQVFRAMEQRRSSGHILAPAKDRLAPRGAKRVVSAPMVNVKLDWVGESREQLLAKPDMLPKFVRDLPRAYIVPPRSGAAEKKSQAAKKRKLDAESEAPAPPTAGPTTMPHWGYRVPPPVVPLPDPTDGPVVSMTWDVVRATWEFVYASGARRTTAPYAGMRPL